MAGGSGETWLAAIRKSLEKAGVEFTNGKRLGVNEAMRHQLIAMGLVLFCGQAAIAERVREAVAQDMPRAHLQGPIVYRPTPFELNELKQGVRDMPFEDCLKYLQGLATKYGSTSRKESGDVTIASFPYEDGLILVGCSAHNQLVIMKATNKCRLDLDC